jgi:hypothetical protein
MLNLHKSYSQPVWPVQCFICTRVTQLVWPVQSFICTRVIPSLCGHCSASPTRVTPSLCGQCNVSSVQEWLLAFVDTAMLHLYKSDSHPVWPLECTLYKSYFQPVWPLQCFICIRVTPSMGGHHVAAQFYEHWSLLYLQIGRLRLYVHSTRCFLPDKCTAHCRRWHRGYWWSDGTPRLPVRSVGAGCFPVAARHPSARWFWVAGGSALGIPGSVRHRKSGRNLREKTITDLWFASQHSYGSRQK